MSSLPDPARIPDELWEYEGVSSDGLRRHYVYWIDKANGVGFRKTENLAEDALLAVNKQRFDDSQTERFGDGKIIASIPINVFYRDFAKRMKEGDDDFTKWWLNNSDNRLYRTFRGRV